MNDVDSRDFGSRNLEIEEKKSKENISVRKAIRDILL